ncbi:NnrU family protein [Tabrizicola sp.]|uniref:NnrU family protein n=1 Tax=Tabrizicola sp. TaxID=2005166 RepID=UPI002603D7BA|nr:NnrU family protein [Tabrizicola sp.]MDM7932944.1 NnrU family protein [Tabrizicola sp.]
MTLIVLGLALWWAAHLFKRLAPARRAAMGDAGKGLVTVGILAGVILMVIGYRGHEAPDLWYPPAFLTHVNNLLMLLAFYLYAASGMKTRITRVIRHPQLTAVKTWAVAHLLVNGDLASVVLFGGLLAWAVVEVIVINRAEPRPAAPEPAAMGKEIGAVVGAVVVFGAVAWAHNWLGVWPYG